MHTPDHFARVDVDRLLQNGRWSVQVCRAADRGSIPRYRQRVRPPGYCTNSASLQRRSGR